MALAPSGRGFLMMIYQEKISPPVALPADEQQTKLIAE
jgi:hypothetical protein